MKKILLYSGGMDSWLIDKIWKPDEKVYVNMNTRYSKQEMHKIKSKNEDVTILNMNLGKFERDDKIIPLRNLYLTMLICNYTDDEDVEICLGATAGDRVLDKSKDFVDMTNNLLNYLYQPQWWINNGKKVKLNIDFKDCSKEDLLSIYTEMGGSLEEAFDNTFSCYEPDNNGKECWACKPCFRKFVTFAKLGYKFSDEIIKLVIPYMCREIIPQIESGSYGRGEKEEAAIMKIYNDYKYVK